MPEARRAKRVPALGLETQYTEDRRLEVTGKMFRWVSPRLTP